MYLQIVPVHCKVRLQYPYAGNLRGYISGLNNPFDLYPQILRSYDLFQRFVCYGRERKYSIQISLNLNLPRHVFVAESSLFYWFNKWYFEIALPVFHSLLAGMVWWSSNLFLSLRQLQFLNAAKILIFIVQ